MSCHYGSSGSGWSRPARRLLRLGLRLLHAVPLAELVPGLGCQVAPLEACQLLQLLPMKLTQLSVAGADDLHGCGGEQGTPGWPQEWRGTARARAKAVTG